MKLVSGTTIFFLLSLFPVFSQVDWRVLADKGDSLRGSYHYEESIPVYEELLKRIETDDVKNLNIYRVRIGLSYFNLKELNIAEDYFTSVISSTEEDTLDEFRGHAFNNLGVVYQNQGRFSKSIESYNNALRIFAARSNKRMEYRIRMSVGIVYREQGQYKKAMKSTLQSINDFESIKDSAQLSESYSSAGVIQDLLGATQKAKVFYEKSIEIRKATDDLSGLGSSYNNLGIIYLNSGDLDSAIYCFNRALIYMKQSNNLNAGPTYHNLGKSYYSNGDIESARSYFSLAIKEKFEKTDTSEIVISLNEIASLEIDQGELDLARKYLEKGKHFNMKGSNPRNKKMNMELWAAYYRELGMADSAYFYLSQAHILTKEIVEEDYLESLARYQEVFEAGNRNKEIGRLSNETKVKTKELKGAKESIIRRNWIIGITLFSSCGLLIVLYVRKQFQENRELKARLDGIEEEKNRISRELHDIVGIRIKHIRGVVKYEEMTSKEQESRDVFSSIYDELTDMSLMVREISHVLKLPEFNRSVFSQLLSDYVFDWFKVRDLEYFLIIEDKTTIDAISREYKVCIYRFIFENLVNIEKHAEPTEVSIEMRVQQKSLIVSVSDNSINNLNNSQEMGYGIGHRNLREFAQLFDGWFIFELSENGSLSKLILPLKKR